MQQFLIRQIIPFPEGRKHRRDEHDLAPSQGVHEGRDGGLDHDGDRDLKVTDREELLARGAVVPNPNRVILSAPIGLNHAGGHVVSLSKQKENPLDHVLDPSWEVN